MAAQETVLRLRICLRPDCRALFFLCSRCDRGRRYCSDRCSTRARREQRRRANQRHQRSPEGQMDHRDRQRRYRARKKKESPCRSRPRVTDQASNPTASPASLPSESSDARPPLLRCRICGRVGRFIDPFPRAGWRQTQRK